MNPPPPASFWACLLVCLHWGTALSSNANLTLPEIYGDHMIFQTGQPLEISGRLSPIPKLVEIEVAGHRGSSKPTLFGGWTVTIDPIHEAGGSHALTIYAEGEAVHTLEDVTFGDVWLCGGQSNMEWDMATIGANADIQTADHPDIRLLEVRKVVHPTPDDAISLDMEWTRCQPASIRNFSAVGYFFGRELHQETGRPIGLIQSAWGGSRIETWIPDEALQTNPYAENINRRSFNSPQHRPSICYNAMIHGLAPLALQGAIWYQGESNDNQPEEYRSLKETLINAWRSHWRHPTLPFYYVQLANYAPGTRWERLREAQTQSLAIPHTGMAMTLDIGNSNDIHPRNKQDVGKRLAAIALAKDYEQDRVYSGPQFVSASTDGKAITLKFDHVGSGLINTTEGDRVWGFEALYSGGRWQTAPARIEGDTVVIPGSIFSVDPQGVRYGWASDPEVSLANKEGFPAVPFQLAATEHRYRQWQDQLVGPARHPEEDANQDGQSNLLEYATANKPLEARLGATGDYEVSFHRRAVSADVRMVLQRSLDLQAWTELWSSDSPESSGLPWRQSRDWGKAMTERFTVPLPGHPEANYRIRYELTE